MKKNPHNVYVQYTRGCEVHRGIHEYTGVVQNSRGYDEYAGGYHEYAGGIP